MSHTLIAQAQRRTLREAAILAHCRACLAPVVRRGSFATRDLCDEPTPVQPVTRIVNRKRRSVRAWLRF